MIRYTPNRHLIRLANPDFELAVFGNVFIDRLVQLDLSLLDEFHQSSSGDWLRNGGQRKHRVFVGRDPLLTIRPSKRLLPEQIAFLRHADSEAWNGRFRHLALDAFSNCGKKRITHF